MRKMIAILLGLALVCTLNSGRVGHTGICLGNDKAKGDVLFIFDTSGSMGEKGTYIDKKTGEVLILTKLGVARKNFGPRLRLARIHAGNAGKFAALVLGRSPRCTEPKLEVLWGLANLKKVTEIRTLLKSLEPDGMTPLVRAFQMAREILKDKDNPGIVLVSDGLETCQKPPKDNLVELKKEAKKLGAAEALKKLPGIYVVFFIPTSRPRPGTALEKALNTLLKELEEVGKLMKAKMIALVNTVEGFGEALEGAVVEALDPAPARLGRLHTTKDLGDLLRVSVYISDDTTISDQKKGDGIIDKGETVQIGFRFRNISTTDLKNFELDNIKTDTSSIVPQKMQRPLLGNLDANKQLFTAKGDIKIKIGQSVKAGTIFKLLLDIKANGRQLDSLEFLFELGSLLTPEQYPTPISPLMIGFSDGYTHVSRKPGQTVNILLSGNPGEIWGLLWDVELTGSSLEGEGLQLVELQLGGLAVTLDFGEFSENGSGGPVGFKIPDEYPDYLPEGKVYFQAVSLTEEYQALKVSNVIILDVR